MNTNTIIRNSFHFFFAHCIFISLINFTFCFVLFWNSFVHNSFTPRIRTANGKKHYKRIGILVFDVGKDRRKNEKIFSFCNCILVQKWDALKCSFSVSHVTSEMFVMRSIKQSQNFNIHGPI